MKSQRGVYCALAFLFYSLATDANAREAACLLTSPNERLSNYCIIQNGLWEDITEADLKAIDLRLKSAGYVDGLGLDLETDPKLTSFYVAPSLEYSTDINGGNPDRPLDLGPFRFRLQDEFIRKEGLLVGLGVGASHRELFGPSRYVDFGAQASYAHSPKHDIGVQTLIAGTCANVSLQENWFTESCASGQQIERDLSEDEVAALSVRFGRLFTVGNQQHNEATVGLQRYFAENYSQSQLLLGWETIYRNGVFVGLNGTLGEPINQNLATRRAIKAKVGVFLKDRPVNLSLGIAEADGGSLLGLPINEDIYAIELRVPITPRFTAVAGYRWVESNNDFFDQSVPSLGIEITPFRL